MPHSLPFAPWSVFETRNPEGALLIQAKVRPPHPPSLLMPKVWPSRASAWLQRGARFRAVHLHKIPTFFFKKNTENLGSLGRMKQQLRADFSKTDSGSFFCVRADQRSICLVPAATFFPNYQRVGT